MEQFEKVTATIKIRRDGREVKPAVESLDGQTFRLRALWQMDDLDQYPGEWAMEPIGPAVAAFDACELGWIASGDLEIIDTPNAT